MPATCGPFSDEWREILKEHVSETLTRRELHQTSGLASNFLPHWQIFCQRLECRPWSLAGRVALSGVPHAIGTAPVVPLR